MRVRKLDAARDMTFGQSAQNFLVDSPEAVAQVVETTLKLFLGEWYLDLNAGTPWLEGVIGYHSKETSDLTLISTITGVENVQSLENWVSTINPDTRKYSSLSATLFTAFGVTQIQLENLENL